MIKNMKKYGYIAFVLCVLAGCASQKQISYLQDVPDDYRQKITQDYDLRIHPDDLLSIMVNSKDPELAQMFNLPMVSYQIANSNTGYAGGQPGTQSPHGPLNVRHSRKEVQTAAGSHTTVQAHDPLQDTRLRRPYPNRMTPEGTRGME